MKFICNSSVLIFLAKLDALHLLQKDFLTIPEPVKKELLAKNSAEKDRLSFFFHRKNVVISKIKKNRKISNIIGKGENAVINLALEKNISLVLMDDRRACSLAKSLGLKPKGTLWIILTAFRKGLLRKEQAKRYIYELPLYGFRIDEALLMEILKKLS